MPELSSAEISDASAPHDKLSRREFARRAAVVATTAVVVPSSLLSQETASKPTPSSEPPPQPASTLSPELQAEGELKYQWIIQTYGKRLTEEQKQDLHRLVMEGQKPLAAFRAFPLENSDQPATVLKFADIESSEGESRLMAISEDVLYLSVRELGERIRTRQLAPVELTQAYLARCKKYAHQLNSFAMLMPDLALQQAREAQEEINQGQYRGPLHGIPYAAKDLLAVAGYPTTWGARPYQNQVFHQDATVIRKLREAGAILLGKAAMIELAGGLGYRFAAASATGAAKNPWNMNCWTCGSSGGSGGIVAGGMAAFAIGTETWGSIVCPSAFCGVSGLRPTFGRVGRGGAMALSYSMDKIGPMCRTADDCSLVLAAISGHDPLDAGSLPEAKARFSYTAPPKPLRIAQIEKAWEKPDPDVAAAFEQAVAVLQQAGTTIGSVQLPEGPFETAGGIVVNVEAASAFSKLIESGDVAQLSDPLSRIGGYAAQTVTSQDFIRAQRIRRILQQKMDPIFQQFDVLIAPSQPIGASPLNANLETDLAFADPIGGIGNLCGLPALSVPCGFTKGGLPIGIQFLGQVLNDAAVIAVAERYQERTDWHLKHPALN